MITAPQELPRVFKKQEGWENKDVINLSGISDWQVELSLRPLLENIPAHRMIVFPDVSRTQRGVLPTGVMAQIDINEHPDWRKYIQGADIGCGITFGELPVEQEDFQNNPTALDSTYEELNRGELLTCLRGNHFVNFASNIKSHQILAVVHTGSYGDMQKQLGNLVDQPPKYDQKYARTIASGQETRGRIMEVIQRIYGQATHVVDTVHNLVEVDETQAQVTLFKGVTRIDSKSSEQVLPSSPSGRMVRYFPGPLAIELGGMSHGTGRAIPRGELRQLQPQTPGPRIMTPSQMHAWPLTEVDAAYNPLQRSLGILEEAGFIAQDQKDYFQPIAGIKK